MAQGPKLDVATLPTPTLPLAAQLVSSDGACWTAVFSAAREKMLRLNATSD